MLARMPAAAAGMLPGFLIVDGQRCGTTSMTRALREHPSVSGAAMHLEVHYFGGAYDRGLAWYRSHSRSGRRTICMPELATPTTRVQASFIAAIAEWRAEGRGGRADATMLGREIREHASRRADPAVFSHYVRSPHDRALEDSPRPHGHVPSTTLWWLAGDEYLGRIAIRHHLTPGLRDYGGHIGYDIRPAARRRGHATAMLAAALPVAGTLGIDPALITCDEDNDGSRKVIEANGGVLEDKRGIKLRYWVPTS
jgi:predicted acetyltransferase